MTSMIGSLGGLAPDSPAAILYRLQQLERRMDQMASARTLDAATIQAGSLVIAAGGRITIEGDEEYGGPVVPAVANQEQQISSFTSIGPINYGALSIPVPPGCTSALVHCTVSLTARGSTSAGSAFSISAVVGSTVSGVISTDAPVNGLASASASLAWSGSVSSSVTAALQASIQSPSTLEAGLAQVSVTCLFLR